MTRNHEKRKGLDNNHRDHKGASKGIIRIAKVLGSGVQRAFVTTRKTTQTNYFKQMLEQKRPAGEHLGKKAIEHKNFQRKTFGRTEAMKRTPERYRGQHARRHSRK